MLTKRQKEFLRLVAEEGCTAAEVAERCFVSPFTVKKTLQDAKVRLGARNLPHAVYLAAKLGQI